MVLILSLSSVACGGKDEKTPDNKENVDTNVSKDSASTKAPEDSSTPAPDKNNDGKNEVGGDKNVTDDISKTSNENVYNVGGVLFQIPDTFKSKDVFVGTNLTFESSKNQSVLSMNYIPYVTGVDSEDVAERNKQYYENKCIPVSSAEDFANEDMMRSIGESLASNEFSEAGEVSVESVTVADIKGTKFSFEGTKYGDCYREAPVKNLVKARSTTYVLVNDIDENIIIINLISKTAKADEADKLVTEMLTSAVKTDEKDNLTGRFADNDIQVGGFCYKVPEIYGIIAYSNYFTEYEQYLYQYSDYIVEEDELPEWWTNINAERVVMTKAEFEENVDLYVDELVESLGQMLAESQTIERKLTEIEGMQAAYCITKGSYFGQIMECKMLFVNDTKNRYFTTIYGIYKEGDEVHAAAFEELVASMKLAK